MCLPISGVSNQNKPLGIISMVTYNNGVLYFAENWQNQIVYRHDRWSKSLPIIYDIYYTEIYTRRYKLRYVNSDMLTQIYKLRDVNSESKNVDSEM